MDEKLKYYLEIKGQNPKEKEEAKKIAEKFEEKEE